MSSGFPALDLKEEERSEPVFRFRKETVSGFGLKRLTADCLISLH